MPKRSFGRTAALVAVSLLASGAFAAPLLAQDASAPVSTLKPLVSQDLIDAFKAAPESLLARHPLSGETVAERMRASIRLSNEVRDLAVSDFATVAVLLELAKKATEAEQRAIGIGLYRAAQAYVVKHPEIATLIQENVVSAGVQVLQTAFLEGNIMTAALGPGTTGRGPTAAGIGGGSGPGSNFIEDGVPSGGNNRFIVSTGSSFFDGGRDGGDDDDDSISPVQN